MEGTTAQTILMLISGVTWIQLVFFSMFLLIRKTENPVPNRRLAAFLAAESVCIGDLMLMLLGLWDKPVIIWVYGFGRSFFFLWGPLLYLYAKSITRKEFRLHPAAALHTIPFLIHLAFMSGRFNLRPPAEKMEIARTFSMLTLNEYRIECVLMQGLILVYILLSFRELTRYRSEIRNSLSTLERHNLSWLSVVLFGYLAHWSFDTAYYIHHSLTGFGSVTLAIMAMIVALFSVQILFFKSMRQPAVQFGVEEKPKYQGSALTGEQKAGYLEQLERVMREQKPHLDPMLTLPVLARKANIPPRYLSQILNESLNQSFFDYVNRRRIEESKHLLINGKEQGKSVLEVLLDAGFNSKSVFNTAFKRYTGMTPTDFLRSN
jgi:AraC-like DNA-binding protein